MEIIFQVFKNWEEYQVDILNLHGIKAKEGCLSVHLKEIEYQTVKELLEEWDVKPFRYASFSKKELDFASYLSLEGIRDYGYPMPDDDLVYITQVYSNVCPNCGISENQRNPFRIKGEPKWGKSKMFSLTWVPDELFVEKAFYTEVFKPLGIESFPVLIHRSGKTSETVVQLKLPIVKEELDMGGIDFKECPLCLRKRYESVSLDFLPGFKTEIDYSIFYGQEFYGPHRSGYRRIFVSQEFRKKLTELKQVKFDLFTPCKG